MKRILFVDDEPNILDGLRRMLRGQRGQWEMYFAQSGEQALQILEREPLDVIVTDMRMPGMDGAMLLERVRERFPSVTRIVLSGHFDTAAGLRAAPVAHQFLVKPCDPVQLRSAIDRACGLGSLLSNEATRRLVSAIGELPSLPRTCTVVMQALDDPGTSLSEVGCLIEQDVAMSAKVLQLVNSAFFGLCQEVTDIRMGVTYLGIDLLKHLVLSVAILRAFRPTRPIRGFSLEALERHSRSAAEITRLLPVKKDMASACFVSALLHDVGKLVLALRMPDTLEEALASAEAQDAPLCAIEQQVLGTTHAEIGAYLLGLWGLPARVVEGVALHHSPMPSEMPGELSLPGLIQLADALAYEREAIEHGAHTATVALDDIFVERYGLKSHLDQLRARWEPGTPVDPDDLSERTAAIPSDERRCKIQ